MSKKNKKEYGLDDNEKEYGFDVRGGYSINKNFIPVLAYDGTIVGFTLPDGRTVRLTIALEIESKDGSKYKYVTSEKNMMNLGFSYLDYEYINFYPIENLL
jgi:hypothetical protein